MRLHTAVLCLSILYLACPASRAQTAVTAVDSLRRVRPSTTWNVASARTADLDCDGKPDTVVWGAEDGRVVVGVVWGAHRQPEVLAFPINGGRQDGFCAAPKRIDVSPLDCESPQGPLPGCKASKGCKAFSLDDGECDPFNFYWDAARQKLAWWRM